MYIEGKKSIVFNPTYQKQYLFNRCYILDHGRLVRLSMPVKKLNTTIIPDSSQNWLRVHLGAIKAAYGKTGYFEYVFPYLESILSDSESDLWTINKNLTELMLKIIRLPSPVWIDHDDINVAMKPIFWADNLKSFLSDNISDLQEGNFLVSNLSLMHTIFFHGPAAINFLQP